MPKETPTYYSNIISVRVTPTELIFDFGNRFPGGNEIEAQEFAPELRIVMPAVAADFMARVLTEAAQKANSASSKTTEVTKQETPAAKAK